MERLTTNKDVSEMSMIELAHNSCYAKDHKARYRDYDMDIDARELAMQLLNKFADTPNEFTSDEDFDDFILDSTQYGTDDILGLISIFYRNLWAMADLRECLAEYEDIGLLPEQIKEVDRLYAEKCKELTELQRNKGNLLKLPCAVGDTVYEINRTRNTVSEFTVKGFDISKYGIFVEWVLANGIYNNLSGFNDSEIGKTVFLTQAEAEAALKKQ